VVIDAYHLGLMAGKKDYFGLMPVASADETLLKGFIDYYHEDILKFFPEFTLKGIPQPKCVFTLRNLNPVGLFVCEPKGKDAVIIHLDYVVPEYRDLRNARYLYSAQAGIFKEQAFKEFRVKPGSERFASYVEALGFKKDPAAAGWYLKPL
jgi:hypothetical protein